MNRIRRFFKENYKELIIMAIFAIVINYPLPYYIFTGGGTSSLNEKFNIENKTISKGSYRLSYVKEVRSTTFSYLLSYIMPNWERVKIKDYQYEPNETSNDINVRDKISLEDANRTAVFVAYTKANKDIKIIKNKYLLIAVSSNIKADNKPKIGDELISVEKKLVDNIKVLKDVIDSKKIGDILEFEFKRNGVIYKTNIEMTESKGKKILGFAFDNLFSYETNPKITFNFSNSESGPSAGFILSLAIYDALIEEDLTNGLKIVGSGTITMNGDVFPIGGINYKLVGAVKDKADVFFAPAGENYEEAKRIKEKNNYKIDIVEVKNIDDAINYLKSRSH